MGISAVIKGVVIVVLVGVLLGVVGLVVTTVADISSMGSAVFNTVTGSGGLDAGDLGTADSPGPWVTRVLSLLLPIGPSPDGGLGLVIGNALLAIAGLFVGWFVYKMLLRVASGGW